MVVIPRCRGRVLVAPPASTSLRLTLRSSSSVDVLDTRLLPRDACALV